MITSRPASPARPRRRPSPAWCWLGERIRRHGRSAGLPAALLAVVGLANAWNLQGWPGRVNDDEGTYVAQAWALLATHHLSHYTYWYDHPPLGWVLIAAWAWLTDGFHRDPSAVMVGREVMWLATMVSCALLYLLCRRLGFRRVTAGAAVALLGLSPLAVYYHRMVSLDNLATTWTLAALTIAVSPRRGRAVAFWTAACFAAAVLSKETAALLLPAVAWALWQHTAGRARRREMAIFLVSFSLLVATYPLYAALRGQLAPARGHPSLAWSVWWQLFGRPHSGSLLDPHSATFALVRFWVSLDPWLLAGGVAVVPAALFASRLRPFACGLLVLVAVTVKGGYLPYAFVTAMLPLAALLIAGVADGWWAPAGRPLARRATVLAAVVAFAAAVAPHWGSALRQQARADGAASSLAATAWILHDVPTCDVVVVDDYMWLDLRLRGMHPLWMWKTDKDPQVTREVLPRGYHSIGYVVLAPLGPGPLGALPTLKAALAHSKAVKSFGDGLTAREVVTTASPAPMRACGRSSRVTR